MPVTANISNMPVLKLHISSSYFPFHVLSINNIDIRELSRVIIAVEHIKET